MLNKLLIPLLILGAAPMSFAAEPTLHDLVPDLTVKKLATNLKFIEGPVWTSDDGGYLVFSDIPASILYKWSGSIEDGGKLTVLRNSSHNANGNTRDRQDLLITCETAPDARRITRTEKDGSVTVLCDHYRGQKFNATNDVVVKSDGTLWFTDPTYGMPKGTKEIQGQYVFCLDPQTNNVVPVATDFDQPNGLCFSPDESKLYIADSGKPHHIRVFDVASDHTLADGRLFCTIDKGVPDGIRCDANGNVWSSAGDGIQIFSPDGKLIGRIPVPESPANLAFGGRDNQTLFITARTTLYAVRTAVAGANCPALQSSNQPQR